MTGRGRVNPWPAFADMMFMLALTTLVVAAGVVTVTAKQREQLEHAAEDTRRLKDRLVELGFNPEDPHSCGLATGVVEAMEACLRARHIEVERRGCSLSMDAAIQFESNSARLSTAAREVARRVAGCVIRGAEEVARFDGLGEGVGLDAISIEGHADGCGYRGWPHLQSVGMQLPADRAKAVYDLVFEEVTSSTSGFDDGARARILGRIATRSFGPYRPLSNVACDCAKRESCAANRRVEIVVQGKIGKERPNWVPSGGIAFGAPGSTREAHLSTGEEVP